VAMHECTTHEPLDDSIIDEHPPGWLRHTRQRVSNLAVVCTSFASVGKDWNRGHDTMRCGGGQRCSLSRVGMAAGRVSAGRGSPPCMLQAIDILPRYF
jgi:hypothetical protein